MRDKNSKVIIILNLITVLCGSIALVLLLKGGVDFMNPIIWVMGLVVLSSVSSLITQYFNRNNK